MLTIFHTPRARSQRIIWLCEEMGVPYTARIEKFGEPSKEFLAANPLVQFPAITDDGVSMTESVAIMIYIMNKYGPTDLDLKPSDPSYARYLQMLVFGEAGMAMYGNPLVATRYFGPEDKRESWTVDYLKDALVKRLKLVEQQLEGKSYIVGDRFTAADISVGYSLGMVKFATDMELPANCTAYAARLSERPAYQRALAVK